MQLKLVLLVALGGAIGSALRYLVNLAAGWLFGVNFPWGTVAVNIAGSLAMGLVVALAASKFPLTNELRVFAATGILGGFTTFPHFPWISLCCSSAKTMVWPVSTSPARSACRSWRYLPGFTWCAHG